MGDATKRRGRVVACGLIVCGAGMLVSAASASASANDGESNLITSGDYSPGDPTTTVADTTPEDTTATTVDDYAPGDEVVTATTEPVVAAADATTTTAAAVAGSATLPRTGGEELPLGLVGLGSVAGGSALLAGLRGRKRS